MNRSALSLVACLLLLACSSDDDGSKGGNNNGNTSDAGVYDGPAPDPNENRDTQPASCFASCSNTAFACETRSTPAETATAELSPSPDGCTGTFTKNGTGTELKIDCNKNTVCIGTACATGSYSAFSFGYTAGNVLTVCTRN